VRAGPAGRLRHRRPAERGHQAIGRLADDDRVRLPFASAVAEAAAELTVAAWRRLAFYLERLGRDEDARNLRAHGLAAEKVGQEPWWSHPPETD
jgi:hypothetical protein